MKEFTIGKYIEQPAGYTAFIPDTFPPVKELILPKTIMSSHTNAMHLLGKLDGITEHLPDRDLFLLMFIKKDASSSSQIEGTNATIMDVIEKQNVEPRPSISPDVDDVLHYIDALNYGMERSIDFPFSLRFIRAVHERLMSGARSTQPSYPGEFRKTQNWIGGTRPGNALFVPPPMPEMHKALDDFEKFIQSDDNYLPLIKAGLMHSQFEAIHPFVDGNGRTGRMLITMFLWQKKLLEMPVLYLSTFFKKHQKLYYEKLNNYHDGKVFEWLDFFLEGIISTTNSAIETCRNITRLYDKDMKKIHALGKTSAKSTLKVLVNLYEMPIVGIADIVEWSGFTTVGGYKLIERLVKMNILEPMKTGDIVYRQKWIYSEYLSLFSE